MLILAIDTSGRHGSVAVCRGDAASFETMHSATLEGGTYSARLIPTIDALLQENLLSARDLDGFAIVSGPGSFTGLRVGLATVKGLCEILQKPLVAVSMLEAVAITHGAPGRSITAILDAGRGEVYVGEYEVSADRAAPVRESIFKLNDFATTANPTNEFITPDGSVSGFLHTKSVNVRLVAPLLAENIGRIGIRKLLAGELADHATVDVNYIRRSDAELFSAPKH